jgi:hypothetical protein
MRGTKEKMNPRDIYQGAVLGGAIIGVVLAALGALLLLAALRPDATRPAVTAVAGAVFFAIGALFVLVSVIVLPAVRAIRLDAAPPR